MIIVSGEPRSGTSMMMKILKELGIDIIGEEFLGRGKNYNPTGIWEVYGIPNAGIDAETLSGKKGRRVSAAVNDITHEPLLGECIKLTTLGLLKSDPAFISGIIYCLRDPREVIVSQRGQIGWQSDKEQYDAYNVHMAKFTDALEPADLEHILFIDYADIMFDPVGEIRRVADFLDWEGPQEAWDRAVSVPDPKHYRSKKHKAHRNKTAESYYNFLRRLN